MRDRHGVYIGGKQRLLLDGEEIKAVRLGSVLLAFWSTGFGPIPASEVEVVTDGMCGETVPVSRDVVRFDGPDYLVCNQRRLHGGPCGWIR